MLNIAVQRLLMLDSTCRCESVRLPFLLQESLTVLGLVRISTVAVFTGDRVFLALSAVDKFLNHDSTIW